MHTRNTASLCSLVHTPVPARARPEQPSVVPLTDPAERQRAAHRVYELSVADARQQSGLSTVERKRPHAR
eukprot:scaffold98124_cov32-Tisochrysis_lutea.AAC.1